MVYLLHFHRPYKHAAHYIGYVNSSESLDQRLERHRRGDGARLMQVITEAGIGFEVARIWPEGDRRLERRLKNYKKSRQLCPICRAERRCAK